MWQGRSPRWVVASVATPEPATTLALARQQTRWAHAVEIRLDPMVAVDVAALWEALPLPAIATCRPAREGGHFRGPEPERLARLREAAQAGAVAVDVEWDTVDALGDVGSTLLIVSRHVFDGTPPDVEALWEDVARRGGDVVKVATYAHTLRDALRVATLFRSASRPTIAIAMGPAGIVTRLLAPAFPSAFLTYAAPDGGPAAAPGQVNVRVMHEVYAISRLREGAAWYGYMAPLPVPEDTLRRVNRVWAHRRPSAVLLPLPLTSQDTCDDALALAWEVGFRGVWLPAPVVAAWRGDLVREGLWVYPDGRTGQTPLEHPDA